MVARTVLVAAGLIVAAVRSANTQSPESVAIAAKERNTAEIRRLLSKGASAKASLPDGATALHWAAHWDQLDVARMIIDAGADVNAVTDYGVPPLWQAAQNGSVGMTQLLLDHGARATAGLPSGETALMTAARTGAVEVVRALLRAGAAVNAREGQQAQTALMWAAAEGHTAVVQLLLDNGAALQARSEAGSTALMFATRYGHLATVELLLARGSVINDAADDGTTSLLVAIQRGHVDLVRYLLDRGANPNASDGGYTALHWAVARWESAQTYDYDHVESGEWAHLVGLGDRSTDVVKMLLNHGADVNVRTRRAPPRFGTTTFEQHYVIGATPFYLAALSADVEVMRLLVANGADTNVPAADGSTALMVAAGLAKAPFESRISEAESLEAVTLALSLGQEIRAKNKFGNTALHGAAMAGHDRLAKFLVESGADINARNLNGATALALAEDGFMFGAQLHVRPAVAAVLRALGAAK